MKYVKMFSTGAQGKTHIVPKHSVHTLCGYKFDSSFMEIKWHPMEGNCLFCVESLNEMIEKTQLVDV